MALHVLTITVSTVSLCVALLAVYWFFLMRRNFRRDLVLLLILGGSWKSAWFLVFSVVSELGANIPSESSFCQTSGYFLQVGFAACDAAILFISMHMSYQIFPPKRPNHFLGHDGIYRARRWILAAFIIFPNLSAALAFVNPSGPAYREAGGFCGLPFRPIWYRLALFWIPRYLIWMYVLWVAVRIYVHVGREFKVFGLQQDDESSSQMFDASKRSHQGGEEVALKKSRENVDVQATDVPLESATRKANDTMAFVTPDEIGLNDEIRPSPTSCSPRNSILPPFTWQDQTRRRSGPDWFVDSNTQDPERGFPGETTESGPSTRRGSRQIVAGVLAEDFAPAFEPDTTHRPSATDSSQSAPKRHLVPVTELSITPSAPNKPLPPPSTTTAGTSAPPTPKEESPLPSATPTDQARLLRATAIQRQLRLLFIYPCVYLLLWIIPFVQHCMNYTDYFARNPVFVIRVLQLLCMTGLTLVDVSVFCWREKPWRHIHGSDGTFGGSLMWWRFCCGGVCAERRASRRAASRGQGGSFGYLLADGAGASGAGPRSSRQALLGAGRRWSWWMQREGREEAKRHDSMVSSVQTAPGTLGRAPPPRKHRRILSSTSDRQHQDAQLAYERLAWERAQAGTGARVGVEGRREGVGERRRDWFDVDEN